MSPARVLYSEGRARPFAAPAARTCWALGCLVVASLGTSGRLGAETTHGPQAVGASSLSEVRDESRRRFVWLSLPELSLLPNREKLLRDLEAGLRDLEVEVKVLQGQDEPNPTETPPALRVALRITSAGEATVALESAEPASSRSRTLALADLPESGRELAIAVLLEEVIRGALAETSGSPERPSEPQADPSSPENAAPEPVKVFPATHPGEKQPKQLQSATRVSWLLAVAPTVALWESGDVHGGTTLSGGLRLQRWQLEVGFGYARLLDRDTLGSLGTRGTGHGELLSVEGRGLFRVWKAGALELWPMLVASGGLSRFWATSEAARASTHEGPTLSLDAGIRLGWASDSIWLGLDARGGLALLGTTATVDGQTFLGTSGAHAASAIQLGVRLR